MRFIPSCSPVGSLHSSLLSLSWPILELLRQCWGCWSLSLGSTRSVQCLCSADYSEVKVVET